MGRLAPAPGEPRGGTHIPASRPASIRLTLGAGALLGVLGVSALLIERAQQPGTVAAFGALSALALLAGVGFRRPGGIAGSVVLLLVAYAVTLVEAGEAIDAGSLVVAGALFCTAELGFLAVEAGLPSGVPWRRLLATVALAAGSALPGVMILAAGQSSLPVGPVGTAAGVAGALLLTGIVVRAGRV